MLAVKRFFTFTGEEHIMADTQEIISIGIQLVGDIVRLAEVKKIGDSVSLKGLTASLITDTEGENFITEQLSHFGLSGSEFLIIAIATGNRDVLYTRLVGSDLSPELIREQLEWELKRKYPVSDVPYLTAFLSVEGIHFAAAFPERTSEDMLFQLGIPPDSKIIFETEPLSLLAGVASDLKEEPSALLSVDSMGLSCLFLDGISPKIIDSRPFFNENLQIVLERFEQEDKPPGEEDLKELCDEACDFIRTLSDIPNTVKPAKILCAGTGGTLNEFIGKLGILLEVETSAVNPLGIFSDSSVDKSKLPPEEKLPSFAVPVGLALESIDASALRMPFPSGKRAVVLPSEEKSVEKKKAAHVKKTKRPISKKYAAVALLVAIAAFGYDKRDYIVSKISDIKPKIISYLPGKKTTPAPEQTQMQKPKPSLAVTTVSEPQVSPGERSFAIFKNVKEAIPNSVWLTNITTNMYGDYFIEGLGFSKTKIKEFVSTLGKSSKVKPVSIPSVRKGSINGIRAFKFTIWGKETVSSEKIPAKKLTDEEAISASEKIAEKGKELGITILKRPMKDNLEKIDPEIQYRVSGKYSSIDDLIVYIMSLSDDIAVSKLIVFPEQTPKGKFDRVIVAFGLAASGG